MIRRVVISGALVATVAGASCADAPTPQPCLDIPPGGCPLSHGVACDDPACEAVYACAGGNTWVLDHTCPPREAGSLVDAGQLIPEAAPPRDADLDAPPGAFGGPGCTALQLPDCSLGTALLCGASCCGCEDLFVCDNGGWTLWGSCIDGGVVAH